MDPAPEAEFEGTSRFAIRRRLGAGGMGVVYEAYDRDRHVNLALKTLRTPSPDAILRLKTEFRALQDIQHRNLVHLGELFEDNGVWFFTMELVAGTSLLEHVRPGAPAGVWSDSATADTAMAAAVVPFAGTPARAPVRVGTPSIAAFDEARLRDALAQLARGLVALHRAGKIHRDVKPSNILVDASGRVVLLDFGLVSDTVRGPAFSEIGVVGTAGYMAPEQALGRPVGPAADWYSVGVVLYEALTGFLPFAGTPLQMLNEKQRQRPSSPAARTANLPVDLEKLCLELLEREPDARPDGESILRRLGAGDTPATPGAFVTRSSTTATAALVGREAELEFLGSALDEVRRGRQVCAFVHGESGIGKSTLVHSFAQRMAEAERAVVLAGRCYEREAVRYRVLDGVIDALSRYLQRLPPIEASALIPQWVSTLLQLFPVLRRVAVFAQAPRREGSDPQELRTRAFAALRELFARLADRRALIIVIDDLQWADVDGLALLSELLRPPDAPPFLLIGSWREAGESTQLVRQRLDALPGDARHLRLERLPEAAACTLAARLLAQAAPGFTDEASAASIAREAMGNPLFIDELVRYSALSPERRAARGDAPVRLEDVLWARIEGLEPLSRRLLEVVAVAGSPIDKETATRATEMDLGELSRHAALLRSADLVRTTGTRATDTIEPYHDRVRSAMLSHLDAELRRTRHRELAHALDASGRADPEALVEHYRGAGDLDRAGRCAGEAAAHAARALAFDQAAALYRLALELLPAGDPTRRALHVELGDALANAGRGPEAARAYQAGTTGASAAETLDLQLRAAQQQLLTGHIDEGIGLARSFLEREGIRYPTTPRRALWSLLWRRAQLRLRGMGFHERDESLVSAKELKRLDACYHVGITLGLADNVRGQAFQARGLLLALRAGEPGRLARALAAEGISRSITGKRLDQGEALFARAEQLARRVASAYPLALVMVVRAQAAFARGEFPAALRLCDEAQAVLRERCSGAPMEKSSMHLFSCRALQWMGDYDLLAQRVPDLLREFARRNDRYAATGLRTSITPLLRLYTDDDAARAHVEVAEALREWSPAGFHMQHYYAHVSEVSARLYEGDGEPAYAAVTARWPEITRAYLMRVQFIRSVMHDLRARAALTVAASARPSSSSPAKAKLLAAVGRDAARLEREQRPWSNALAELLHAGIALGRGDLEVARARLGAAIARCEAQGMKLHAAAARRRMGTLLGGDEGSALVAAADAWMAGQRILRPDRVTMLLAPG